MRSFYRAIYPFILVLFTAMACVAQDVGVVKLVAGGNSGAGFAGDGLSATDPSVKINGSTGVCMDAGGNIYFGDANSRRIRKVSASNGIINTIAGTGVSGYSGDGGLAT